jgi:hypothetical protein
VIGVDERGPCERKDRARVAPSADVRVLVARTTIVNATKLLGVGIARSRRRAELLFIESLCVTAIAGIVLRMSKVMDLGGASVGVETVLVR